MSAPAYVGLLLVSLRNSLPALMAGRVPPDLGYARGPARALQAVHTLCLVYLFAVYGVALWKLRRRAISPRGLVWAAAVATAVAVTLVPAASSDLLEYIGFGRIAAIYHADPYAHTYSEFEDQYSPYVTWDEPMPYGPVVLPVFSIGGLVSKRSVLGAVYFIKGVWALVHLANIWLVYILARRLTRRPEYAAFLYGFNPLLLVEQPGNGHNDGLLIFFVLAGVWALIAKREALAIVLAFLAVLVKTSAVFWLAGMLALVVRQRRWQPLALGVGAIAVGAVVVRVLLPACWPVLAVMDAQWRYSEDSVHSLVIDLAGRFGRRIGRAWEYDTLFWLDRAIAASLFLLVCVKSVTRIRDARTLVDQVGRMMGVLLLGVAVSVYPWYWAWLLPVAALTNDRRLQQTITLATATGVALYAFPAAVLEGGAHPMAWVVTRLTLAFGVPLAYWWSADRVYRLDFEGSWTARAGAAGWRRWLSVAEAPGLSE